MDRKKILTLKEEIMYYLKNVKYKNVLNIEKLIIPKNKITCIIGESGSGKTTLLRLLNKLISCDSGEILFKEQNLRSINSIILRREVVMLSQNPAIFKGTIKDNLLVGLKFCEKPICSDEKLKEILNLVQLKKCLKDNCSTLSGGEKQRIALGRILLLDPEALLLDEPSSALDEQTEHLIINSLVNYTKDNLKTLIMVTHSKKVALTFSDYIIEIQNGRVLSEREV